MDLILLKQLGISLILSSLIGLEREQKYQRNGNKDTFGGIRTFALIGLIGTLAYILSEYSIAYFIVLTSGFFALLVVSYLAVLKKYNKIGATSDIAAILVYIIGILCGMEKFVLATVVGLITLSILHFKTPLHKWAKHLKNEEIVSTIEFIVIAFVVLPLLPNQNFGPYDFFNPYIVWLMVVFISAISYASYIAIKFFGAKKGIGVTGFLAGFISSTALTLSFSEQSRNNRNIINPYVLAVIVASSAMFFRIIVEVAVLNPDLLRLLIIPMLSMGFVGIISILFFWFKKDGKAEKVEKGLLKIKSPFSIWPAIKFGVFFAFILLLVKFSDAHMGNKGIYITSLISGIMDVDAITIGMAGAAREGLNPVSAVIAITLAAMMNTFAKGAIFMILGNRKVGVKILSVFLIMLIFGGISLLFVH